VNIDPSDPDDVPSGRGRDAEVETMRDGAWTRDAPVASRAGDASVVVANVITEFLQDGTDHLRDHEPSLGEVEEWLAERSRRYWRRLAGHHAPAGSR
jgi:hypothetical protein